MQLINLETVRDFTSGTVEISIHDKEGDIAPFVKKQIKSVVSCPDATHVRIYFDSFNFFAIPLTSKFEINSSELTAFDDSTGLCYIIKKVDDYHG